jgi:hypothetical protein
MKRTKFTSIAAFVVMGTTSLCCQDTGSAADNDSARLTERGSVVVEGRSLPYVIRHLPVSSFPDLPAQITEVLSQRGCKVPQTYEAHRPENVIHASFEKSGSSDWAVLCSAAGTVSLLVFFGDAPEHATMLATAPEKSRLQAHGAGEALGFDWGIDAASPENVREAQASVGRRTSPLDHDAIADSVIEGSTVYHLFVKGKWTLIKQPQ